MGGVIQSKVKVKAEAKQKTYLVDTLTDHEAGINTMALSDDGAILASGSDDHTVRLWTTTTDRCECVGVLVGHDDYVNCVLIEETYVFSASADKTIRKLNSIEIRRDATVDALLSLQSEPIDFSIR